MREIYLFVTRELERLFNSISSLSVSSHRKIASVLFPLLLLFCVNTIYAQGPGATWEYSRSITLSTATPLDNFQVKVTLSAGQYTNIKADGSDLRFYDNSNVNCSYWIEKWDNTATSVIWVKVTTPGANSLKMYYGNPSAAIASNGSNTFDFFDDFQGTSLNSNWLADASGGTIAVAGGQVALSNTNGNTVSISSAFTPTPGSFIIEAKHKEGAYRRNRFYASDGANNGSPLGWDYGYFARVSGAQNTSEAYWSGFTGNIFSNNTDYLTRWNITDGSTYSWSDYNYSSGVQINSQTANTTKTIRFLIFSVTEQAGTSTLVDWARVRKAGTVEITTAIGPEVSILSAPVITSLGSSSGCSGTNITINGTGFTTIFPLSVKIGATPVSSIVSNNGTTIVAIIGAGTTGNVTIVTSGGTGTSPGVFTVNMSPTANAGAAISPICQGGFSTSLGGSIGGGATSGTWSDGGVGGTFSPNANNLNATWTPPTSYSGTTTLTLVTGGGVCGVTSASKTLQVNPVPAGSLNVSATSVCAGSPVAFTAPAGYYSYNFRINGTTVLSGASNTFSSTNLVTGNVISVIVSTTAGCTTTFTAPAVTVNQFPAGTFSVSENSGIGSDDNIVCQGDMVNFDFDNTSGNTNYKFILNNTTTLYNGSNPYFSTSALSNGSSVTLEVTGPGGCIKTFGPQVITVTSLPAGSLTIQENSGTADDGTICIGSNVKFTAPPGFTNYDFQVNGTSVQSGSSNIFNTTVLNNNDAVSVTIINSNNCSSTLAPVIIIVNPLPAVSPITGNLRVCANNTTALTDAVTGGIWSSQNTGIASIDASGIVTGVSAGTATINYTITNTNGCSSTVQASVTVDALPVLTAITGNLNVCAGNSTQLNDAITGGIWSSSNIAVATINSSGLVNGISAGTATINYTVTNGNGCTTIITAVITVHALPLVAPVTGAFSACVNSTTLLADATAGGIWGSNNAAIASVNPSTGVVTGMASGTATISYTVVNGNNCSTTVTADVIINALPIITLTGPNPICLGSTGNVYTTEAGQSNYVWNITGGTIDAGGTSTDNTVTVSWTAPGMKKINVNYSNINGCTAATSATFTNSPAVVPVLTGSSAVCLNSTGNIYTTDGLKTDYIWTINGGAITSGGSSADNTATVTWNASGTKSISINYTNVDGCNAATPTIHPVVVNTLPTATISGTIAVCQNGTASFIFTGSAGTAPYTFTYNINGAGSYTVVTSGTGNTGTVMVPTATPGVYAYNLISVSCATGCSQPATGTATATVTATPFATISYNGTPFCTSGGIVPVIFSGTTGGTFSSAPGLTINSTNGTITPSSSIGGAYTVTYTKASSGGCAVFTTTTSVTITSLPTATISYMSSPFCKSVNTGQPVTLTGTGAFTGGTYSAPSGLTISSTNGSITPNSSTAGTYTVTYTISSAGGCGAVAATTSVTITAVPVASISYTGTPLCSTTTSAPVSLSGTGNYSGGTYSSATGLSINAVSGTINPSLSTPGAYTVTYTSPASGGCVAVPVTTSVAITGFPTVSSGTPVSTCASSGAVNITPGSSATNYSLVTWTSNGTGTWTNANSLTTATYNPSPADIATGSITLTLTASGIGNCTLVISTKTLTINANPPAVIIDAASTTFCQGTIQPLTSVKDAVANVSLTFSSGNISLAIPDDNPAGVYNMMAVSGIPAGAVINSVTVKFNITHTYDADLFINLKAPNNTVLNLANGLNGINFSNTFISSAATQPIQTFGVTPYSGTYLPQAQMGVPGATSVPGGSTQSGTTSFSDLYSAPNGNWYVSVRDGGGGDTGTLDSCSITFNYSVPAVPVAITWSPLADLYTDAAATVPYTGQNIATVYAKPASAGMKTYTATAVNASGCTTSGNISLTVKASPVVTVIADYCSTPGNVTLTANATGAVSYNWSTGETTQTVLVDIAHDYYVSVSNSNGCIGTGARSIAQELVVNGDFTAGNTGFVSEYAYKIDLPGVNDELVPDDANNGYAVGTSGQNYHFNFWGLDHTNNATGNKNFMLLNGHGNTISIWKETVNVSPNTDYYFSAWAMSLNSVGPYAKLQFEVNGVKVGTIANLVAGPTNATQAAANNYWTRFYSNPTWNSGSINGPVTIRIINNENSASGNDFALDDISFGTLSPFVTGPGVEGTDNQVVCAETPIENITYKVGSGATGPQVTGLPPGVSYTYDGLTVLISGTPATPGNYNYSVGTAGTCPNPKAATGTIKVNPKATIALTSANNVQTLCVNSNINLITYSVGGGGTGAAFTGLPAGISASYLNGAATLSGSASAAGIFNYTVTTTGACNDDSLTGVITLSAASSGGIVSSPIICIGDGGSLLLSANVGSVDHWETSNDGIVYTPITNTSNSQSFTNITQSTFYRVQVKNATCPADYSTGGKIKIHNLWEGKFSSDWSTPQNWSSGTMPDNSCTATVTIPKISGTNSDPVITGSATVTNLNIKTAGHLTINGGNLQVSGTITNSGVLDAGNGGVEYNGSAQQAISINTFLNNKIKDLKISNSNATGVTMNGPIDVSRSLTYGAAGKNLNTGGFLTLKSTLTETAWLGNMTGHTINGEVTVERYIATGTGTAPNHGKSWQLLAVPTFGPQSIKQSWQEGASATNVSLHAAGSAGNPIAGFGTMLTSNVPNAATQTSPGFDAFTSPGPSIKVYNYLTNGYDGPSGTALSVYNQKGYFILVRGDRSIYTSSAAATPTVLRTKGTLFTPANLPPVTNVVAGKQESIGNPYASAIDLRSITKTGGVDEFFYVWDPRLGGESNLGAFQTLYKSGNNYYAVPAGGSYGTITSINNFVQSGQAFIVEATGTGGTVSFKESDKASGSALFSRPDAPEVQKSLQTSLYGVGADGSTAIVDGVLNSFDDFYSNSIDGLDAKKSFNTGENLSVKTEGQLLAIERKHTIIQQDTIFLNLTGVRAQLYQFQFNATNLNRGGLEGFFEDNYLHTRTPLNLNGSTVVNFSIVNIPGSYANDRFRIVFAPAVLLPVTFTSVKAYRQDKNINVEWSVENEMNMKQYEVEKSINGIQFNVIAVKSAAVNGGHSAIYVTADVNPVEGYNYYRIKSLDINGKAAYSNVVKVMTGSIKQDITIYPNPITDGMIHLQLMNQPEGKYGIRLLNKAGQVILAKQISHTDGNDTEMIKWDFNLAHGMYVLEVTKPGGGVKEINVMY